MVLDHILPSESDTTSEQEIVHAKFVLGADGETCNISSAPVELTVPTAQVHTRGFGKPWVLRWMGNKPVNYGANSNMRYDILICDACFRLYMGCDRLYSRYRLPRHSQPCRNPFQKRLMYDHTSRRRQSSVLPADVGQRRHGS